MVCSFVANRATVCFAKAVVITSGIALLVTDTCAEAGLNSHESGARSHSCIAGERRRSRVTSRTGYIKT